MCSVLTVCDVIEMLVVPRSVGVVCEGAVRQCIDFVLSVVLALALHTGE